MILAGMLRKDSDIRAAVARSIQTVLPRQTGKPLVDLVESPYAYKLPTKSTVSRFRLILDIGYTRIMREQNAVDEMTRYFMADSSTQGGRDLELMICCSVRTNILPQLRRHLLELIYLRPSCRGDQPSICFQIRFHLFRARARSFLKTNCWGWWVVVACLLG